MFGSERSGRRERPLRRSRLSPRAFIKAIAAVAFASTVFSGCATVRQRVERNPLAALSGDGALYLVIPVKGNEELVSLAVTAFAGKGSAHKIVERTDVVYACAQAPSEGARSVRVVATGSFPKSAAAFAFRESAGWERRSAPGVSWYHAQGVDVAIPARGTLCAVASGSRGDGQGPVGESTGAESSGAEIRDLLARVSSGDSLGGTVSREFAEYAATAAKGGTIGFFAADPGLFVQRILGPDVSLPIRFAEGYAERREDGNYTARARITLADARSAKALRPLIARAFPGAAVAVDSDAVTVRDFRVEKEKLAELAIFSYLEKK